ncbi:hypothetical protein ACGF5C_19610 [Micromonospora sp. NPDC047620]|uniref:hypothetical protein n=1 Tax=Micromonospora sp. NPDC047620 TaxID=3364251 RepID=UPI003711F532
MPAVAVPSTSPTTLDTPAGGAFAVIFTRLPALLRLTCGGRHDSWYGGRRRSW